jgi:cytochrome c oxidase subunit II
VNVRHLVAYGLVVAGVVASFALAIVFTARRMRHTQLPTGPNVVHVEVTAKQYMWLVRHPGEDGVLGTSDDIVRDNELRVPVGRDVVVHLKSRDVVHGMFLPAYGTYRDVVPGHEAPFWFRARVPENSVMLCSQICGPGHSQMQGRVMAVSEVDWHAWQRSASH